MQTTTKFIPQVTFRGVEPSDAVTGAIEAKAAGLARFAQHVTRCHVTVEAPHRHQHQGGVYTIHIDLRLPGGQVIVGREHRQRPEHADVYVALRDAFDAAARQLEDYVRRQRGDVKHHEVQRQAQTRSGED